VGGGVKRLYTKKSQQACLPFKKNKRLIYITIKNLA
jgi:hypothetical protein